MCVSVISGRFDFVDIYSKILVLYHIAVIWGLASFSRNVSQRSSFSL